ncbi:MAG: hypothetical protein J4G04_02860, partial [Nitrosopumilaceae archaeon]|nr:hypothetical protein [Nitrosopumilaceae archaeon]
EPDPEMLAQVDALQSKIQELESAKADFDSSQIERITELQNQLDLSESISVRNAELLSLVEKLEKRIRQIETNLPPEPESNQVEYVAKLEEKIRQLESAPKPGTDPEMLAQVDALQSKIQELESAKAEPA